MQTSTDLFLGTFLIMSGFALSLINLRRIVKQKKDSYQTVLLSENVLLTCIGIAFVSRAVYEINPMNIDMERAVDIEDHIKEQGSMSCSFMSNLMGYGPLVVSMVNSFVSLIIDNYMHYMMLQQSNKAEENNAVQDIGERSIQDSIKGTPTLFSYIKTYFPVVAAILQWVIPIILALSMYPIQVKEKGVRSNDFRNYRDVCMTMLDVANESCFFDQNHTLELRDYLQSDNYLNSFKKEYNTSLYNKSAAITSVVDKVLNIVNHFSRHTNDSIDVSSQVLYRKSKETNHCLKMCYLETKSLLMYLFLISVVSYFVPITISTVILTKIHSMNVKQANVKTFVSRELLYNILFWTPVMFDTFVSLLFCSYTMNGTRTSIFHVIANIYQAVKNFMNTKFFKDNVIVPV